MRIQLYNRRHSEGGGTPAAGTRILWMSGFQGRGTDCRAALAMTTSPEDGSTCGTDDIRSLRARRRIAKHSKRSVPRWTWDRALGTGNPSPTRSPETTSEEDLRAVPAMTISPEGVFFFCCTHYNACRLFSVRIQLHNRCHSEGGGTPTAGIRILWMSGFQGSRERIAALRPQ